MKFVRTSRQNTCCLLLAALLAVALVLLPAATIGNAQADEITAYFADIPDMPLMAGFDEQPDGALSFDKPEGRIVEAEAAGHGTAASVFEFYRLLLPELGWVSIGNQLYLRQGEVLSIEVTSALEASRENDLLRVRFYLRPE